MKQNLKKEFMEFEILAWSIIAGFSRGINIYKNNTEDFNKAEFKKFLKKELRDRFGNNYHTDSKTHIKKLSKLKEDIDRKFGKILDNGEQIYFGRVQKIVNLYLKYRWVCFNERKPVHCPFDSNILNELGLFGIRFTRMTEDQYREAIKKVEEKANRFENIAEWEIKVFNSKNPFYQNL
ncbi:hypothetical protein A3B05_03490 [Candidatus Giovannonibacteria bacterium RIFCSPLOWO2_01_FULL_43_160]|uniref:Uncharacterized protein n=1 Tax=Candidatus Giovannonibacteria bacterium RIFCSPLOWO2_12_FULL_43_26 TaxID=1798363 RepID=A0A1F5XY48_9BACT|nr:MAG: hypothetical protein A2652_03560 [Candidatus Giovannonibacteria bacterium RIFCSPHIGHO2_01_FULL_43_140]OGF70519.1 MAG: hypothetical protein A3C76_00415 [Candidatus Giovannonibacteria bacterium RIFCSPHIGHO2_02_FULL_44_51]OGF72259.1 MAG: hypothetical protein A3E35_01705 [Candidatus Giovannonibacteria bacterium RIFCSPHIGHO2_12_FULL_44_22]OGF74967.1 MAG: hypothetical protein A3B05_03490 [Candidatus Giovannonibacteria bacterium RIFCSPLOWO2_01_FULL_43_160]OGF86138.1 MAG: hypothetical protein A